MNNELLAARFSSVKPESDSFDSFFERHYKRIYHVLYRLTGQKMEAEDLTIETFIRYLRRRPASLDQEERWLYRVATRLGINALRAAKRRVGYEQKAGLYISGDSGSRDPSMQFETAREQSRVRAVLCGMPARQAQALVLHHSGFSYKEIAEAMGIQTGSVGTLLSRAHKEFERRYVGGD